MINIITTGVGGVHILSPSPVEDERGWFARLFCSDELRNAGFGEPIAQINRSRTRRKGTVRGMHFQYPPVAETKIVHCLRGKVFDVALDLRRGSPTLLKWHGEELDGERPRALLIPPGVAHGFQALTQECELLYLHSAHYSPKYEGGVRHDDPRAGIRWPLTVTGLSKRDQAHTLLSDIYQGISL